MKLNLPTASVPSPKGDEIPFTPNTQLAKVAFGLALLTFFIYLPVIGYTFVNYDDDVFVTNNKMVAPGFTWEGVKWAFTSTEIDYWRPLSWLSHMLDVELFGIVGGLHHLSNLLIHIAATVMLLIALNRLTRALWPSVVVSALFAWHPLHVESVAWVAERKDVLCGFFWFFTLWAYARYVERPKIASYALVLIGFVLGVMSKPMIVTLPFALLLLDFWPLKRINPGSFAFWKNPGWRTELRTLWVLIREKLPLLAIVAVLSVSTFISQREVGTMSEGQWLSFRLATAFTSYATYLRQTFWPTDLCVLYPVEYVFTPWKWIGSTLLCVLIGVRCLMVMQRHPFMIVGWLWFLGILVPVIGLVQVGEQAHANRYTYVPLVGIFLMLVWLAVALGERHPGFKRWSQGITVVILLACAILTRWQLQFWEDSVHLFKRAVDVNPRNVTALNNLGAELLIVGEFQAAAHYLETAVSIRPRISLYCNLAGAYFHLGQYPKSALAITRAMSLESKLDTLRVDEWIKDFQGVTVAEHQRAPLHKFIAVVKATRKDYQGAVAELQAALRITPQDVDAQVDLGAYLAADGKEAEALKVLQKAVENHPDNELALSNYGSLLARNGRPAEALASYQAALKLNAANADTRHNYAIALVRANRPLEAKRELEEVLRRNGNHLPALQQLTWLLATRPECRDAAKAGQLAKILLANKPTPLILDTAAAAAAAAAQYDEAVRLATQGIKLAHETHLTAQEEGLRVRLLLYQARQPFTQ